MSDPVLDPPAAEVPAQPTFDVIPLSAEVRKAIDVMGYKHPTPVQRAVYDLAVRGKDLVVQARTGTGKTAAFGLPIVDQLIRRSVPKVQALVLCPTRELALQVASEIEKLAQFRGTKVTAIYGGAPMGRQVEALQAGAQIVAGTPGRVLDHLRRGTLDASNVRIFVLDEADEMLSMGFAKELHAIVEMLPKDRQGLFFSATIPPDIERLAQSQLKSPEFVTLSSDQVGALEVDHFVYLTRGGDKRAALIRILEVENPESAIIFCNTKEETERLSEALLNKGFDADWLNGDLDQRERESVMTRTRGGTLRFLVATDVAARGIDISHLTHVINHDFPETAEYYVHRTGRTGRAGKTGTAISIVGPKDIGSLYLLRLTYKIRPIEKQLPTEGEIKTRSELDVVELFEDAFGNRTVHPDDLAIARRLLTHFDAERIVAGLVRDHLGARPGDPQTAAAEARRAKNPPPVKAEAPAPREPDVSNATGAVNATVGAPSAARPPRRERSDRGPRERQDRGERSDRGDRSRGPSSAGQSGNLGGDTTPPGGALEIGYTVADEARGREGSNPQDSGGLTARERAAVREPRGEAGHPREPRRRGMPHTSFRTWEPPEEKDDDVPLIARDVSDTIAVAPLSSPSTEPRPGSDATDRPPPAEEPAEDPSFAQIFVNVGRRDGARAGDLQRLLEESAGIAVAETGRIRVRDRMTFVSVKKELVEKAIGAFTGQIIGGRNVVAELARGRAR